MNKIQWGRVLRRGMALFLATVAVWALLMTAGVGSAADAVRSLGESGGFVSAALRAELGDVSDLSAPLSSLDGWGRLVVDQSAFLRAGAGAVAARMEGAGVEKGADPDPGTEDMADVPAVPAPTATPAPEDTTETPISTAAPDTIVPQTLIATGTDGYAYADGVFILNRTQVPVDAPALAKAEINVTLGDASAPQVLIMHTHGTEAYTPDGKDIYTPTDPSRTLDTSYNMIRVGNEIKAVLEEMGLSVLHDEGLYDYPYYKNAYVRSGEAVQKYLEQYPSIKIVLDIHRDALIGEDGTVYKAVTTVDGNQVAQVMLTLGSPEGGEYPNFNENLALAMKLQQGMNTLYPTLARPITIRKPVYNQALTNGSLLVEVGCHGNTLQEALGGARLFARAAGQVLVGLENTAQ